MKKLFGFALFACLLTTSYGLGMDKKPKQEIIHVTVINPLPETAVFYFQIPEEVDRVVPKTKYTLKKNEKTTVALKKNKKYCLLQEINKSWEFIISVPPLKQDSMLVLPNHGEHLQILKTKIRK